jgi:hypothetical protein
MSEQIVYHTTPDHGVETFHPKPYWHTPDYFRSGILKADTQIPEGAVRSALFFAMGKEKMWYWLTPKDVIKTMFLLGSRRDARLALGLPEDCNDGCVVFDIREKDRLERLCMSTYEFDVRLFRKIGSGEYVTDKPVSPMRETRWVNAVEKMQRHGVHVICVDDIHAFLEESRAGRFGAQHIVSHRKPIADRTIHEAEPPSAGDVASRAAPEK